MAQTMPPAEREEENPLSPGGKRRRDRRTSSNTCW